jgi:hypothetical protein
MKDVTLRTDGYTTPLYDIMVNTKVVGYSDSEIAPLKKIYQKFADELEKEQQAMKSATRGGIRNDS